MSKPRLLKRALAIPLLVVPFLAAVVALPEDVPVVGTPAAEAAENGLALKPYLGWSSWSQQSSNYPGLNPKGKHSYLHESNVLKQADAMAANLKQFGYEYINMDAGWWMDWNWNSQYDGNGRQTPDREKFPRGMKYVADYIHGKGLKAGIYLPVGLEKGSYDKGDLPIDGAPECTTHDIVHVPLRSTNGWDSAWKIDYSKPCAQKYVDSQAKMITDWGFDFLKFDGVGPGAGKTDPDHDNRPDVAAMSTALIRTGRNIVFEISAWPLHISGIDTWKRYANAWRPDTDVECYCNTLVTWDNSVKVRWNEIVPWIPHAGPGGWMDLDSLNVGNGQMDGITPDERRSYMTLWSIAASPLYIGDDLTKLDALGLELYTNPEVIAVNQQGKPARPVRAGGEQQVWWVKNTDNSYTVALFNLSANRATVTANWTDLGFSGNANVRDLWTRTELGSFNGKWGASIPKHGTRLLRVTPGPADTTPPSRPANPRVTGVTSSSVSLAWDRSTDNVGVAGYDIYRGADKASSSSGTSATVAGLTPNTEYTFTVIARDANGNSSPPSDPVTATTADGPPGPTSIEAESGLLMGRAAVRDCGPCSGGKKVGDLYHGGGLELRGITVATAGSYRLTVTYTTRDPRSAQLRVNGGAATRVNFSPTGGWNTPGTLTVTINLQAGANTLRFDSGSNGYAPDLDKLDVAA